MKAIKVNQLRQGSEEFGDKAILRDAEEFAAYFKRRYALNKRDTESMRKAYELLIGWNTYTVDWPTKEG